MTFTYKLEYLTVFLEKVIPMGVEICSRSGYPATECNFLSKLCIHSDIDHFGIPTSFFRKLTWKHSDKTLKPICHSENPAFLCPFSTFATRCFPALEKSTGEQQRPRIPSSHQQEGWSCLPAAPSAAQEALG